MYKGLVSIIVPVYNRKHLVKETIQSLVNQHYQFWEAILVDDGSTDGSCQMLEEMAKEEKRLRVFYRTRLPKGGQACRNMGVENAQGEYVLFLDSDDLLAPYCLEQRVEFLKNEPGLDFAVFNVITFEKYPGDINILWNVFNETNDLQRFLSADSPWQTSSPLWRKNFVAKLHWDEGCISGQDWDFHVRALAEKPSYQKIDSLPDCFIRRDNSERISMNFFKLPQVMNRQQRWQSNFRILNEKGLWKPEYNKSFAAYYFVFCEQLLIKGNKLNVWKFYFPVYRDNLLSVRYFFVTLFYLVILLVLINNKNGRNYFKKKYERFIPSYLKKENQYKTQEKIKLQGEKLKELILRNKNFIKINA